MGGWIDVLSPACGVQHPAGRSRPRGEPPTRRTRVADLAGDPRRLQARRAESLSAEEHDRLADALFDLDRATIDSIVAGCEATMGEWRTDAGFSVPLVCHLVVARRS